MPARMTVAGPVSELLPISRTGLRDGLGEVAGQHLDDAGQDDADDDRADGEQPRVAVDPAHRLVGGDVEAGEGVREVLEGGDRDQDGGDDGRDEEAAVDGAHAGAVAGAGRGGVDADQRGEDTDGRDDQREDQALGAEGGLAEDQRGDQGHGVGLEQVGRHAGAVTDVVADVVGDGGGVARVVLGDALLDLADQVGADVSGLGEDAAADTHEHGEQRATEAEALEHVRARRCRT